MGDIGTKGRKHWPDLIESRRIAAGKGQQGSGIGRTGATCDGNVEEDKAEGGCFAPQIAHKVGRDRAIDNHDRSGPGAGKNTGLAAANGGGFGIKTDSDKNHIGDCRDFSRRIDDICASRLRPGAGVIVNVRYGDAKAAIEQMSEHCVAHPAGADNSSSVQLSGPFLAARVHGLMRHQHRNGGLLQNIIGDAAEKVFAELAVAAA
jgi:hypothetical protein